MTASVPTTMAAPLPWAWCGLTLVCGLVCVDAAFLLYSMAQPLFGAMALALAVGIVLIFVLFPVIYSVWLGFTYSSSFNLLPYDRAVQVLMVYKSIHPATERKFAVTVASGAYRIWLPDEGLLSSELKLDGSEGLATLEPGKEPDETLPTKDAIKLRAGLQTLELQRVSDGVILRNSGLRIFAKVTPEYEPLDGDRYCRVSDGAVKG